MVPIRVASYNLRGFRDDRWVAASVVRTIDPDVLCLQEVPRLVVASRQVAAFAAECELDWAGGHRRCGGTTVMTSARMPVLRVDHHRLPVRWPDGSRGYAVAELAAPSGHNVRVVSGHLSLREQERVAHLRTILDALGDLRRVVLAGDVNEEPGGAVWTLLEEAGLRPVSPDGPTFTARHPRWRLDGIFAGGDLEVEPPVPLDLPQADLVAATDHRPLWADVRPVA